MTSQPTGHRPGPLLSPAIQRAIFAFVIVAVTLAVYAPVKQHPFINIDDYGYVVNNFHIQQLNWDTVKWSFTTFHYSNWDPVTWLSHALDIYFYGLDPGRHHETSLLIHTLNALLLFWLLSEATGYVGRSFAAAAIFALHPVNVEAVAWVAERKTVLSMSFFLLTLIAYRWYARRPEVLRYVLVAVLCALAMMSKPQSITLPCVLLLWDYWPLGRMFASGDSSFAGEMPGYAAPAKRFSWLVLEKVPLLLLSAGSAYMTMKAQWANGTLRGLNQYPFSVRLGGSIVGYVRYLWHALWPQNLSFFYPHAHGAPPAMQIVGSLLLLLLITAIAIAARRQRYLAVGWLWFLGTLVPMIELVQVGNHSMADRYGYLPYVGLFIAICWGVAGLAESSSFWKASAAAATIVILVCLSFATRRQVGYWTDDIALWTHSAEAVKNNAMAENMIGENLLRKNDRDAAIAHFRAAAAMDPEFPFPQLHIGIYEEAHGHPREAIEHLQKVIELTDKVPESMAAIRTNAFANISFAYNQLGDYANQQKYLSLAAQQRQPEQTESNGPQ